MDVNDYLTIAALRKLEADYELDQITHRMVVDQLIALRYFEAANRYLQPFASESNLDSPVRFLEDAREN